MGLVRCGPVPELLGGSVCVRVCVCAHVCREESQEVAGVRPTVKMKLIRGMAPFSAFLALGPGGREC